MAQKRFSDYMNIKPEVNRSNSIHSRLMNEAFYSPAPGSLYSSLYHRRVIFEQRKNNRILTSKEKYSIKKSIKRTFHLK